MSFHSSSLLALTLVALSGLDCLAGTDTPVPPRVIISVRDQKLMVVQDGKKIATYPVSTSRFGIGDRRGSMATPLGWLQVAQKIGDHAPTGAVFHNRRFTGEILTPNAPGRDPIVTRIIWLRGLEKTNSNAFERCIYIHGTPQEKMVGRPASYGCIRMCSKDVQEVYAQIQIGALVKIIPDSLPKLPKFKGNPSQVIFTADAPNGKPSAPMAKSAKPEKPNGIRKRVSSAAHLSGDRA
jgi:lipoprotein-anchoring transpeptidase ErfK/SrfK